jgi:NADH:ubiquinone oxidoreductase subunit 3 (subunit A)
MERWVVSPPVVFILIFAVAWLLARLATGLAFKPRQHTKGERTSYACGEDTYNNMAQPDYSTFFAFAFFFTLAHVATLVMTTVPRETLSSFVMAAIYILGAVLGLSILLRK